jgi:hypothetical protein
MMDAARLRNRARQKGWDPAFVPSIMPALSRELDGLLCPRPEAAGERFFGDDIAYLSTMALRLEHARFQDLFRWAPESLPLTWEHWRFERIITELQRRKAQA